MEAEGQLLHGFYGDECEGVPVDLIERYYGAEGPRLKRNPHQRGAGSSQDEEMEVDAANEQIESNAYPHAVAVPQKNCPFDKSEMRAFKRQMKEYQRSRFVPNGYFVRPDEWDEEYLPYEDIQVGRHPLRISLTLLVWLPRAEDWARGVYLLACILSLRK
ncbi:hypothetical protein P691DRAFT_689369 [Macrolepiota fuliginosa MF-IS2]|uniref:Uncharacterized protein n=1 Tax=Macrolepiota fuliginosa MF-IS2 TaxID=1400762 RepID=A0A9P5WWY1_9AGAR|nr:hypothetical protein P691DRAFT_689369 [Macrolepiota fuliginosa MF-IS2]